MRIAHSTKRINSLFQYLISVLCIHRLQIGFSCTLIGIHIYAERVTQEIVTAEAGGSSLFFFGQSPNSTTISLDVITAPSQCRNLISHYLHRSRLISWPLAVRARVCVAIKLL